MHAREQHGAGHPAAHGAPLEEPAHGAARPVSHAGHEEVFRRRFWVCLALSVPALVFSLSLQSLLGHRLAFPGSEWITPALARADVGIAIGSGTDVAIESAGIILVKSNPLDVVGVIRLSRASYRKMVQNLAWATGYNVVALPLAAGALAPVGILLSPAVGALLMSLSTIIVAINAQLLRRQRPA